MWRDIPFSTAERIQRFLRLADQADRDGSFDLGRIYRRMARDLGPAPAARRVGR